MPCSWGHLQNESGRHSSVTGALGASMCHANTPQSLLPWGHLCVTQNLLSQWCPGPGGIYRMSQADTPQSLVPWGHLCVTQTLLSHWCPGGIYVSRKHSLVTGALALGASMSQADTPQSLVPWGHLCVAPKHSSIICSLWPLCATQHSSITGALGAYMCHTNTP
jgi:hypothetical protein